MATESDPPPDKKGVDWGKYAEDARDLFLATSSAGPTAMRVWTTAWCEWATSAAKTHDELVRKWTSIIRDPSRGGTVLNNMREDVKQYLVDIAGIPERSVLEFLEKMSEVAGSPGKGASTPDHAFVEAADDVLAAAAEALNQFETTNEFRTLRGSGGTWAGAAAALTALREKMSALSAAGTKLRRPRTQ